MSTDPGLQAQRTTLAWTRTGIAAAVLAGVLIRAAIKTGSGFDVAAAAVGLLSVPVILGLGSRAFRPPRRVTGPLRRCDQRGVQGVTGVALLLGVLTIGSVLLG